MIDFVGTQIFAAQFFGAQIKTEITQTAEKAGEATKDGLIIFLENPITKIAILVLATIVANRLLIFIIKKIIHNKRLFNSLSDLEKKERKKREDTIISVLSTTVTIILWTAAFLMALSVLGINIGPLLTGAGIAGVALGFGAQALVRDFLAGIFILLEEQYRVGDVVELNPGNKISGVVEKITLRMTQLRGVDGQVFFVPNGKIDAVVNSTVGYSQINLDVGIKFDEDIERVKKAIEKISDDLMHDEHYKHRITEPLKMLRIENFTEGRIDVRLTAKTYPGAQWEVRGEILRRIKDEFIKDNIEIPVPKFDLSGMIENQKK